MKLSDAEWTVMDALWQRAPASAREVLERIHVHTGWAYTTVKTMLERLAEKGALRTGRRANVVLYEPLLSRKAARREALRALLDKAFDGAFGPLFQHLMVEEKLSKKERAQLASLLESEQFKGS